MTTRAWKAPPAYGSTVHVISDTHLEVPATAGHFRIEGIRRDLDYLPAGVTNVLGRVHCGDVFHNGATGQYDSQMALAQDFFTQLRSDGLPLMYSVGNHELNWEHTAQETVSGLGLAHYNYTKIVGPFKFIMYAAADGTESGFGDTDGSAGGHWVIPSDVLTWIDTEMGNTSLKVILVSHCSMWEQFADGQVGFYLEPREDLQAIFAAHPNLIAHFNGHKHHWYQDDMALHSETFGTNTVALLQASSCGGTIPPSQATVVNHPVDYNRPNGSMFCTYFDETDSGGERWEIRWRDHSIGMWGTPVTGTTFMKTVYL